MASPSLEARTRRFRRLVIGHAASRAGVSDMTKLATPDPRTEGRVAFVVAVISLINSKVRVLTIHGLQMQAGDLLGNGLMEVIRSFRGRRAEGGSVAPIIYPKEAETPVRIAKAVISITARRGRAVVAAAVITQLRLIRAVAAVAWVEATRIIAAVTAFLVVRRNVL